MNHKQIKYVAPLEGRNNIFCIVFKERENLLQHQEKGRKEREKKEKEEGKEKKLYIPCQIENIFSSTYT